MKVLLIEDSFEILEVRLRMPLDLKRSCRSVARLIREIDNKERIEA